MSAAPGLLVIWNTVAAEDDAEFNAWYEAEHLAERLSVPGFHTARRYRGAADPLAYCALYDTDSAQVMSSDAYRARLADPTPRTRAIMPRFRNVSRAACEVVFDSNPGAGPVAALAILTVAEPGPPQAALANLSSGTVRVRLARPDAAATGGPTPEQSLRPVADQLPPAFVLLESADPDALDTVLPAARGALGAASLRVFSLIAARAKDASGALVMILPG